MERFYWLSEGELAGCSRPGGPEFGRGRAIEPSELREKVEADLRYLRQRGISAILSLTETPLNPEVVMQGDFAIMHMPVPDLQAPTREEFNQALGFIDHQRLEGRAVAVHCLMGQGRTGTILAAYLIRQGMAADDAIAKLRAMCPGAIGTEAQVNALRDFMRRREWFV